MNKAIRRNFGGLIDIDPVGPFVRQFREDKINMSLDKVILLSWITVFYYKIIIPYKKKEIFLKDKKES